jgi:pSer/pThr/pTyr-binding forkhead associated (FHA) protein
MPGHMTSAYPTPDHPWAPDWAPDWATPPPVPPADPAGTPMPGHLVVVEAGRSTALTVAPGQRLLVGRDPDAQIRVSDPQVSARHATIERRGDGWVVQDVDATNPTRLIDEWGMSRTVRGETAVSSGQIGVGDVLVTLYPNQV